METSIHLSKYRFWLILQALESKINWNKEWAEIGRDVDNTQRLYEELDALYEIDSMDFTLTRKLRHPKIEY